MRESRAIMADLARTGMTPEQIALVMELSAAVSAEARPVVDEAAQRRRERDREYQAQKRDARRQMSADSDDAADSPSLSPAPFLSPQTPQTNPHPHTHPDNTTRARKGTDFPMLDCTDPATWADFLRNRKAKRLPNTASAHRKLETDLAAMAARTGWPPGKVFAACVERGWGAIYDPRDKQDGNQRSQPARQAIADIGRSVAADLEREATARLGY